MSDMKPVDKTSPLPELCDSTAPALRKNPFPMLHRLRDVDPIHRSSRGWIVSLYRDCARVLSW